MNTKYRDLTREKQKWMDRIGELGSFKCAHCGAKPYLMNYRTCPKCGKNMGIRGYEEEDYE